MDTDAPVGGNPHQVSPEPDPGSGRAARAIALMLAIALSWIFVIGGVHAAINEPVASKRLSGAIIAAGGLPGVYWTWRRLRRRVRGVYRLRRDRCVHCGYDVRLLRAGTCPECGNSPWDL